jgi:hypothetical protein
MKLGREEGGKYKDQRERGKKKEEIKKKMRK